MKALSRWVFLVSGIGFKAFKTGRIQPLHGVSAGVKIRFMKASRFGESKRIAPAYSSDFGHPDIRVTAPDFRTEIEGSGMPPTFRKG
ncbi:hypothetical protein [Saccharibacillus alkalitolerans]|uniref:Uncharacterized protein n=1 Tax=Saccharibacillus alkalitolerans TaxID=2705290 RepID=A0ABX0F890_9BACL|nr:hypothetical protein [Saccharibacillus alkalitolerans]NGZ77168.1 hypothetical protein [Saccharibacillus alkalitolerans]